jgi:hypothetical protein
MYMDGPGDHDVKQSKPDSERQRLHVFSHMWKIGLKGKCIHKYKHDHYIYICVCVYIYIFSVLGLFEGTGRRKRKRE